MIRKTTVSNDKMLINKQTTAKVDDCVTTYICYSKSLQVCYEITESEDPCSFSNESDWLWQPRNGVPQSTKSHIGYHVVK